MPESPSYLKARSDRGPLQSQEQPGHPWVPSEGPLPSPADPGSAVGAQRQQVPSHPPPSLWALGRLMFNLWLFSPPISLPSINMGGGGGLMPPDCRADSRH